MKIMRDGKPAQVSDFREGDRLSATIITSKPPQVLTEKEVQATLAAAPAATGGAGRQLRGARPAAAAPASAGGSRLSLSGRPDQDAAEDRQLVAAPRARERPVARDGARPDGQAPLRPLGDLLLPGRARASTSSAASLSLSLSRLCEGWRPSAPTFAVDAFRLLGKGRA